VKTKAQVMQFLKDSFAYVHKAIAAINEHNVVESSKAWGQNTVTDWESQP